MPRALSTTVPAPARTATDAARVPVAAGAAAMPPAPYDRELFRQPGRDAVPHKVVLGIAVQEQQWRSAAHTADADGGFGCLDQFPRKAFERVQPLL